MKILVTGSEGFIGTHLKEILIQEGHEVTGIDNLSHPCKYRRGRFVKKDILYLSKKDVRGHDWIVHLAAQINVEKSIKAPCRTIIDNLMGTHQILELSRQLKIPMIFASTTEIYGDKKTQKINENHVMNPKSPYAASKMGADGLCKAYFHSYGTPVIIVRNFNTFGKYQSDDKWGAVIAKFAERLEKGKAPIIFGDGSQKRDFMYVSDAIDFYMLLLNGKGKFGEEYNVGIGKNISIKELAFKMINISEELCGTTRMFPIYTDPRPGEVKEFLCDNRKARSIGWKPKVKFEDGLKKYIEWRKLTVLEKRKKT